jgi:hypothetical protein
MTFMADSHPYPSQDCVPLIPSSSYAHPLLPLSYKEIKEVREPPTLFICDLFLLSFLVLFVRCD